MSNISIIGTGTMARILGTRAVEGGNAVEVIGRDAAKAKDLAASLGEGATAGTFGTAPAALVTGGTRGIGAALDSRLP